MADVYRRPPLSVFGAFQEGLTKGPSALSSVAAEPAVSPQNDSLELLRSLRTLADQPNGALTFSEFTANLSGDAAAGLATTTNLLKNGWIGMTNGVVELTDLGRGVVDTLKTALQTP